MKLPENRSSAIPTSKIIVSREKKVKLKDIIPLLEECELELEGGGVPEYCFLARDRDKLVGAIAACASYGTAAYIPLLAVAPGYREQGVAHMLIYYLFRELKALGFTYFDAVVEQDNMPALEVYNHYDIVLKPAYALDSTVDWAWERIQKEIS